MDAQAWVRSARPVADTALLRRLTAIGNNLNQVARWTHTREPVAASAALMTISRELEAIGYAGKDSQQGRRWRQRSTGYLMSTHDHSGVERSIAPEVLRGDVSHTRELIDSLAFTRRYTSECLPIKIGIKYFGLSSVKGNGYSLATTKWTAYA